MDERNQLIGVSAWEVTHVTMPCGDGSGGRAENNCSQCDGHRTVAELRRQTEKRLFCSTGASKNVSTRL